MPPESAIRAISSASDTTHRLAAIDLGSNSFHLLVADYQDGRLQVIARLGENVQLAAGLDEHYRLSEAAMQRALACLARFTPTIGEMPPHQLRIVGTNALRDASNSRELIERIEALLGHGIEIISGREEARLIYLGAAHALGDSQGRRLVVDIGGGSTELIIGEHFTPRALESLHMGCVTYTRRFFPGGNISEQRFRHAELAALSELANIRHAYRQLGWSEAVGSSGTLRAASAVLAAHSGSPEGIIERHALLELRKQLIECAHLKHIVIPGLEEQRTRIFPAGVAILCAIFEAFDIEHMRYADGALREGVLYDLAERNTPSDARRLSLATLRQRYVADAQQANKVAACARHLFDQVKEVWSLNNEHAQFLDWAAQLHEIGLSISPSQFHRHGAYLLTHSDLPGFSRPEQQALAFLVRAHRRKLSLDRLERLPKTLQQPYLRLAQLLRLAVLLNRSGPETPSLDVQLESRDESLYVTLSKPLRDNALLQFDLGQEIAYQAAAGLSLHLAPATTNGS